MYVIAFLDGCVYVYVCVCVCVTFTYLLEHSYLCVEKALIHKFQKKKKIEEIKKNYFLFKIPCWQQIE